MGNGKVVRFGGISGMLFVALLIPAYLVGTPDAPSGTARDQKVVGYFFNNFSGFLIFNGVLTLFCTFFFL